MKLSEAIREGIKLTKPMRRKFLSRNSDGEVCACALGAALVAVNPKLLSRTRFPGAPSCNLLIGTEFPEVFSPYPRGGRIYDWILYLNDNEGRDREAIALWLEKEGL